MRFYLKKHNFTCGVDLHTRIMYLCTLEVGVNKSITFVLALLRFNSMAACAALGLCPSPSPSPKLTGPVFAFALSLPL